MKLFPVLARLVAESHPSAGAGKLKNAVHSRGNPVEHSVINFRNSSFAYTSDAEPKEYVCPASRVLIDRLKVALWNEPNQ